MLHVYKASAGSGKTYRLALEYLTAALGSEDPGEFRHILAVTFTNKATGEMKDRILAYLFDLARGTGDLTFAASLAHETGLAPSLLAARAEALLKAILHDYDNFRVQTIDAFFQAVLANMSYELPNRPRRQGNHCEGSGQTPRPDKPGEGMRRREKTDGEPGGLHGRAHRGRTGMEHF